jgi:hypothetical protein
MEKVLILFIIIFLGCATQRNGKCISGKCINGAGTYQFPTEQQARLTKMANEWKESATHQAVYQTYKWGYGAKYIGEWKDGDMDQGTIYICQWI